jgi:hypothetical protein
MSDTRGARRVSADGETRQATIRSPDEDILGLAALIGNSAMGELFESRVKSVYAAEFDASLVMTRGLAAARAQAPAIAETDAAPTPILTAFAET